MLEREWLKSKSSKSTMDALRRVKLALDRGTSGALYTPASYFMKSPPQQFTDSEARLMLEEFISNG